MMGKRRIRWLIITGILSVVMLAAFPWWIGWIAGPVAHRFGVTFADYQRVGYTRMKLLDVTWTGSGIRVNTTSLEADNPVWWALQAWLGRPGKIEVGTWGVARVATKPRDLSTKETGGWAALEKPLATTWTSLAKWTPELELGSGTVSAGGPDLIFGGARFHDRKLVVQGIDAGEKHVAHLVWDWPSGRSPQILAEGEDFKLLLNAESWLAWTANLDWAGNRADAEIVFALSGWMPKSAKADAGGWRIPATWIGGGQLYEKVTADAHVLWDGSAYLVTVEAQGKPLDASPAPPLVVKLQGDGGLTSFRVAVLDVKMAGATVSLDREVTLDWSNGLKTPDAEFAFAGDLAALSGGRVRGKVKGGIQLAESASDSVSASANLALDDVVWGDQQLESFDAELEWHGDRLTVKKIEARLPDKQTLRAKGVYSVSGQSISDGELELSLKQDSLQRWIPAGLSFDHVSAKVSFAGMWPILSHHGELEISKLIRTPFRPMDLDVTWRGSGVDEIAATIGAQTETAHLDADIGWGGGVLSVNKLTGGDKTNGAWRLVSPLQISAAEKWSVRDLALEWEQGAKVKVASYSGQSLHAEAGSLSSLQIRPWITLAGPDWKLDSAKIALDWPAGFLQGSMMIGGAVNLQNQQDANVQIQTTFAKEGVTISQLDVLADGQPIVTASGLVPLRIIHGETWQAKAVEGGHIELSAKTADNDRFWSRLTEITGWAVTDPVIDIALSGALDQPVGHIDASVASLVWAKAPAGRSLPDVTALSTRLDLTADGIKNLQFEALVSGQKILMSGELPLTRAEWARLVSAPLAVARANGRLHLEIPDTDVGAWARHLPAYLAPVGRLRAQLDLSPNGGIDGELHLADAATRPLGPLGALQDISTDLRFADRKLILDSVSAKAGGQAVVLAGSVDLAEVDLPVLDITLKGENVPLVRQSGLLIRSDLDLKAITEKSSRLTRLSGKVNLRESLLLADLSSLVPGSSRETARSRPPYFTVNVEPVASWALDVKINGPRFLRIRTPLFTGVATANFDLGGTLRDPRAIGQLTIDQGSVRLPFATFAVETGRIALPAADPYSPRLNVVGTSRRLGYDLRMELSGGVSSPRLQFTSNPALSSEEVLLLVMAGEQPGNTATANSTGGQRIMRLGAYVGQSLFNQLSDDASDADRFSITSGEKISRQGRETYEFEYRLGRQWSVLGEYDEFDGYNLGIKRKLRRGEDE